MDTCELGDYKNELVFKVQIADDRVTLLIDKLQSIYRRQKKIKHFEKDGWYMYCIGEFNSFNEANKCRECCGVNNAFVITVQGDRLIEVLIAMKMAREKKI